ncbi:hypothetical protein ACHHYP_20277 [Achlya hypogyna]|uniref:Uncharacterized protein n=1 Tax=Achlya hypogyna TaxID=1202772 RepID=A0A1V9YTX9_ACHHY|nr:hypothetical protein ACHHYP_20277 [Achlya hypogyna]
MKHQYDDIMRFVAKQRPRALTAEERLDILYLNAFFRKQWMVGANQHIASTLGRGIRVVEEVWVQYTANKVVAAAVPANRTNHAKRVPDTKIVVELVQTLLRESAWHINVDTNNDRDTAACLRAVQTYLR